MMTAFQTVRLYDYEPAVEDVRTEVLRGLRRRRKALPPKLFYDSVGSELFERICELPEYYPTRTEIGILQDNMSEIVDRIGPRCLLLEFGSGSGRKTRLLLDRLPCIAGYVPIDIARDQLLSASEQLATAYPDLEIMPVCADYSRPFEIPRGRRRPDRLLVFFPGSTIGNMQPDEAIGLLRTMRRLVGSNGGVLIGVDLKKPAAILERAYNDTQGVTAAFNLNILVRLNRELGADFNLDCFRHRAIYNEGPGRIEMHLVSTKAQLVHVAGVPIAFEAGETIHTENSYKYAPDDFAEMAMEAGLVVNQFWSDPRERFGEQFLVPR